MDRRDPPVCAAIRCPEALFPAPWFSVEVRGSTGDERLLHPQERRLLRRAVRKRRGEFAAGRQCAHAALARLQPGAPSRPLLPDAHGCPGWPPGTVGSISHTEGCAIGVVARLGDVAAVGVDVDCWTTPFPTTVLRHVCRSEELQWLGCLPEALRDLHAYALFSVKEAIYKCAYIGHGVRLGFADASVDVDLRQGLFRARLLRPLPGRRTQLTGRVGCNREHVFAGVWWLTTPARDCGETQGDAHSGDGLARPVIATAGGVPDTDAAHDPSSDHPARLARPYAVECRVPPPMPTSRNSLHER